MGVKVVGVRVERIYHLKFEDGSQGAITHAKLEADKHEHMTENQALYAVWHNVEPGMVTDDSIRLLG